MPQKKSSCDVRFRNTAPPAASSLCWAAVGNQGFQFEIDKKEKNAKQTNGPNRTYCLLSWSVE